MAMQQLTLAQFTGILQKVVSQVEKEVPTTGAIFSLMYNTGLRANEALEPARWTEVSAGAFEVTLSKGEGTRKIAKELVPELIIQHYKQQRNFIFETYSSVNNTFKRYALGLLVNEDKRRTTSHAFRYRFMQQLASEGYSIAEIAAVMGHVNQANTAKYVGSRIYGPAQ